MSFASIDELIAYIERGFSLPDRDLNAKHETYKHFSTEIVGDVAFLTFSKSTGYRALVVAIRFKSRWQRYFFPKETHCAGMLQVKAERIILFLKSLRWDLNTRFTFRTFL